MAEISNLVVLEILYSKWDFLLPFSHFFCCWNLVFWLSGLALGRSGNVCWLTQLRWSNLVQEVVHIITFQVQIIAFVHISAGWS